MKATHYSCGRERKEEDLAQLGPSFSCKCGRVHQVLPPAAVRPESAKGPKERFQTWIVGLKIDFSIWKKQFVRFWRNLYPFRRSIPGSTYNDFKVKQEARALSFFESNEPAWSQGGIKSSSDNSAKSAFPNEVTPTSREVLQKRLLVSLNNKKDVYERLMRLYEKNHPSMSIEDRLEKAIIDIERDRR